MWRNEWFKPADAFPSFADRFNAARKEFSLFIDNSRMHPSSGVIKLWEKEPAAIEELFQNVLFADANGSVSAVQDHMDAFLDGYEELRERYYPGNWSFKQDRHSASVYLAMNDPGFNYVFKSSEAATMAKYASLSKRRNFIYNFCSIVPRIKNPFCFPLDLPYSFPCDRMHFTSGIERFVVGAHIENGFRAGLLKQQLK